MKKWFRTAVLMIHGFSGNLSDNEYLVNQLQLDPRLDVYAWTLPGHKKEIIKGVTKEDWINDADRQIQTLIENGYSKIIVIGHSMGGVLASYLASKYKEVKKIVLVSSAFSYFSKDQYKEDFTHLSKLKSDPDIAYNKFFIKLIRVPMRTIREFRLLVEEKKDTIKEVRVPALILHGSLDEVVPVKTIDYIDQEISSKDKTKTIIKNARHNVLSGKRKEDVTSYIYAFIKGGKKWNQIKKEVL